MFVGPSWRNRAGAVASDIAVPGPGPYGELLPADANGVMLPAGFTSRIVAVAGEVVPGASGHVWHTDPDGGAVFAQHDGGWVYVSNQETIPGGAGALHFAADGTVADGYRILDGTSLNCAGGPTPWGTWLSCEEVDGGQVYECDVTGAVDAVVRPALGAFAHEAAAVDPDGRRLYLTEDRPDSRIYRFTPTTWSFDGDGTLDAGTLEAMRVVGLDGGAGPWPVEWVASPVDAPDRNPETTAFNGGEGAWYDDGHVFLTTKGDGRVWDLDVAASTIEVLYDDDLARDAEGRAPLTGVDNVTVSPGGEVFVAEDGGNMELVVIGDVGGRLEVASFLRIVGHDLSEVTGPGFHPAGDRLYVSSQRGPNGGARGVTYEITGPFTAPRAPATTSTTTITAPTPATTEAAAATSDPPQAPRGQVSDDDRTAPAIVAATGVAAVSVAATVAARRGLGHQRDTGEETEP